jgi:hypothetical protein
VIFSRLSESGVAYLVCRKGRRAYPPEDVGGIWGYAHFSEAIQNPEHLDHEGYMEWIGWDFDPEALDLEWIDAGLRRLR